MAEVYGYLMRDIFYAQVAQSFLAYIARPGFLLVSFKSSKWVCLQSQLPKRRRTVERGYFFTSSD